MSPVVVHRKYRAGMVVLFRERRWEIDGVEFWLTGEKLMLRAIDTTARVTAEVWSHQVEFLGAPVIAPIQPFIPPPIASAAVAQESL